LLPGWACYLPGLAGLLMLLVVVAFLLAGHSFRIQFWLPGLLGCWAFCVDKLVGLVGLLRLLSV